jgi:Uma2 family endonuclease
MGMPAQETYCTLEMVRALPEDGNRYEVLDGTLLVSPAPSYRHQRAVGLLFRILESYTRKNDIGETLMSPADIELSPTRMVQPDVFVIPADVQARSWPDITRLLLTAEVISSSTARWDRFEKRVAYQDKIVPEYWVVDLDARAFERWRPGDQRPELLDKSVLWQPIESVVPLPIDLAQYFADVWR